MKLSVSQESVTRIDADLLVVPVLGHDFAKNPAFNELDAALGGELVRIAKQEGFTGKRGQSFTLHTFGKLTAKKLRLFALGGKELTAKECRTAGVQAARGAKDVKVLGLFCPSSDPEHLRAFAEGLLLGHYKYVEYLTAQKKAKVAPRAVLAVEHKPTAADRKALEEAAIIAEAVNLARDMVNAPPNEMTSAAMANIARKVSRDHGIKCTVWGKSDIIKHGMTLLAAVNAGSGEEPRFIHMAYVPAAAKAKKKPTRSAGNPGSPSPSGPPRLVFVGKGLTFDSGGLCIKPAKSMETMKCDMAGGAATIAVVMAAARLGLPVEVHGIVPSTDNMTGDFAFKPGDIYRTLDGKTVEVLNTDAEGRLILADALTYARKLEPTVLIDHATLTGACMVALGQWRAALYSNDDDIRARYAEAGQRAAEAFWPMPLDEDLKETIKSPIADLKNTGDGYGGSIAAALFLREFVGDAKWVHLDIAGPAFLSAPHDIAPKGGTGFGVRTALEFIRSYT